MIQHVETYLLNASHIQTTTNNNQTIAPNLLLKGIEEVVLTIRGSVYTAQSKETIPIAYATVVVYSPNGNVLGETLTAEDGSYTLTFDGEVNTNYTVTCSANGYDSNTDIIMFTNNLNIAVMFLLTNNTSLPAIYGRVINAAGDGISNATVNITGGSSVVNVKTMSDGTFLAYDNFHSGVNYVVSASKIGYGGASQTIEVQVGTVGKYMILTLPQNTTNLTSITGRVIIQGSSNPIVGVANAMVGLYLVDESANPAKQLVATVLTDEYGAYTFTNVDGGQNYIIKATKIISI